VIVSVGVAEAIVIVKLRLADAAALSVTIALKLKTPAVDGVPVTAPSAARDSPAGGEPDHL